MKTQRKYSVACVRTEVGNNKFKGCGKGWVQEEGRLFICMDCGRDLVITGSFIEIQLERKKK